MPSSNPPPASGQRKTADGVAAPASGHQCNGLAQSEYQNAQVQASASTLTAGATWHSGLPNGITRHDLWRVFERVAIPYLGLSRTDITVVRSYWKLTFEQDYEADRICSVWQMVCNTAAELNLSSRTINSSERRLESARILVREIPDNGARSGARRGGKIVWANGVNLAPFVERYNEFVAAEKVLALRQTAMNACKAEIRRLNQTIRFSGHEDAKAKAQSVLPGGRTARITDVTKLEAIKAALAVILAELESTSGALNPSGAPEAISAPILQPKMNLESCSARRAKAPRELRLTARLAMILATPEYLDTLAMFGKPDWHSIIEASSAVASTLAIGRRAWNQACQMLGRELAALCVIIIHRNSGLPEGHPYRARTPGGCLVGMTEKIPAGANLNGMIAAMLEGQEP